MPGEAMMEGGRRKEKARRKKAYGKEDTTC
jgi:hypothetical protein